ncbi:MAG: NYN domain-containing protein, partial [Ilumatobacteraceae bacterium]
EEKGTDVNVAAHLLTDVLTNEVDAAIVVSNDSDLALPVTAARSHVPVGVVNPSRNTTAGALRGKPSDGVGRHWWYQLTDQDYRSNQMSNQVGGANRPTGW